MAPAPLVIGAVLSLSGRFARFGVQAAQALREWSAMTAGTDLRIEDDGGERSRVVPALEALSGRCDVLLGPYSTVLMRSACTFARDSGRLVWNHGGSGDDVQTSAPGRVVSVLTPTSRYAESFIRLVARQHTDATVQFAEGTGSFGRQVIEGARNTARLLGIPVVDEAGLALFAAGTFEEDVAVIKQMQAGRRSATIIGTVAAGVHEFAEAVDPEGIFGVAQWAPGLQGDSTSGRFVGPTEREILTAYERSVGSPPDYPAIQAIAAAALAVQCARDAGSVTTEDLWATATALQATTLFGNFDIEPVTGAQRGHRMALVRWRRGHMAPT